MGLMLYDALINWDMSQGDKPSGLIPGLAMKINGLSNSEKTNSMSYKVNFQFR